MNVQTAHNHSPRPQNTRRSFFRVAAALPVAGCSRQVVQKERTVGGLLSEGDRVALKEDPEILIQRSCALGREYEGKYGGCAQCTVAALQDAMDFIPVNGDVFLAASCLDGGATPTAKANCGTFSGSAIVIGQLCGRSRDNFDGRSELAHRLIRRVHDGLVEAFGSVLCCDIRAAANRDCVEVVGTGVRLAAQAILNEFGEYTPRGA